MASLSALEHGARIAFEGALGYHWRMNMPRFAPRKLSSPRFFLVLLLVTIAAFASDQWTKLWAVAKFEEAEQGFLPIISPIFNLQYARNFGINFGFGGAAPQWIWVVIALAISLVIIWWAKGRGGIESAIFGGLVVGGALGNAWDRVYQGFVTDFINNSLPFWHNPFSYNLADIWIFVGVIALVFREPSRP